MHFNTILEIIVITSSIFVSFRILYIEFYSFLSNCSISFPNAKKNKETKCEEMVWNITEHSSAYRVLSEKS